MQASGRTGERHSFTMVDRNRHVYAPSSQSLRVEQALIHALDALLVSCLYETSSFCIAGVAVDDCPLHLAIDCSLPWTLSTSSDPSDGNLVASWLLCTTMHTTQPHTTRLAHFSCLWPTAPVTLQRNSHHPLAQSVSCPKHIPPSQQADNAHILTNDAPLDAIKRHPNDTYSVSI